MMASIYHPQNLYCIAVDGSASKEYQKRVALLGDCFPNVFIIVSLCKHPPKLIKETAHMIFSKHRV